ncbi:MAG: hypothetical protein EXR29_06980 [Betaproteobacteria bacterium]|nr:hypothetical protein [Betaproteobacteria bacterium]
MIAATFYSKSALVECLPVDCCHGHGARAAGYGDYAATTLKLTAARHAGCGCIAWRAVSPQALERRAAAIGRAGLGVGWNEGEFGRGRAYRCRDPDGHQMEIYYEVTRYRAPDHLRSTLKNLPMRYTARGVNVRRTGHLALMAKDVAANRRMRYRCSRACRSHPPLGLPTGAAGGARCPRRWLAWPPRRSAGSA